MQAWAVWWEIQDPIEQSVPTCLLRVVASVQALPTYTGVQTKPRLFWMKNAAITILLFLSSIWSSKERSSYQLFGKLEPSVGHREFYICMLHTAMIRTGSPIGTKLLLFKELLAVIVLPSTEVSAAFWLPGYLALQWFIVLRIGRLMYFPNCNSIPKSNNPLCSAWALRCYFLSCIILNCFGSVGLQGCL